MLRIDVGRVFAMSGLFLSLLFVLGITLSPT